MAIRGLDEVSLAEREALDKVENEGFDGADGSAP